MFHSFPPQTSAPEKPPIELVAVVLVVVAVMGAAGGGWGDERLKTELEAGGKLGLEGGGGEVWDTGAERSKRSPMAEDDA